MKDLIPARKKGEAVTRAHAKENSVDVLHQRMNDLFDDFFEGFEGLFPGEALLRSGASALATSPNFEVSETDDEFRVKAELPGMDEKDIEVTLEGNELRVQGEKKHEREEKHRNYHVSEVSYGSFARSVQLPEGVDREHAKAQFKRGVLTLTLPKTEQAKAQRKRIAVEAE
jgi:HSP20 family protein